MHGDDKMCDQGRLEMVREYEKDPGVPKRMSDPKDGDYDFTLNTELIHTHESMK